VSPVEYASGKRPVRVYIAVCLQIHCKPFSSVLQAVKAETWWTVMLSDHVNLWVSVFMANDNYSNLLQRFLYRDRLCVNGTGCLECRHTHQYDALQGGVGGVRRTIPRTGERRLVDLPQHRHSVAGDVADIGRHQRSDHGRPPSRCPVTVRSTKQLPCPCLTRFPTVFRCAWTNRQLCVDTSINNWRLVVKLC